MGIAAYRIREPFRLIWWQPLERAGFTVQLEPGETRQHNQGGWVHFRNATVAISIPETLDLDSCGTYSSVTIVPQPGTRASNLLADTIIRIFLASGATALGIPRVCKKMYHCSTELAAQWSVFLKTQDFEVLSVNLRPQAWEEYPTNLPLDLAGIARKRDLPITIFIGPTINSRRQDSFDYLALDVRPPWFAGEDACIQALNQLDGVLVSHGAEPIEMVVPHVAQR